MPIKPENKHRYPKHWPQVRADILERAQHRCEHDGCGVPNGAVGYWLDGRFVILGLSVDEAGLASDAATDDGHKVIRVVLTIAHLDHTPENCEPTNLRAWCQRHHLAYDHAHHLQSAYMTRRAARNNLELEL